MASQTSVPVSGGNQRSMSGTVRPAMPSIQNRMNSYRPSKISTVTTSCDTGNTRNRKWNFSAR